MTEDIKCEICGQISAVSVDLDNFPMFHFCSLSCSSKFLQEVESIIENVRKIMSVGDVLDMYDLAAKYGWKYKFAHAAFDELKRRNIISPFHGA